MADKPKKPEVKKSSNHDARFLENKKRRLRKAIKRSKGMDTQAREILENMP